MTECAWALLFHISGRACRIKPDSVLKAQLSLSWRIAEGAPTNWITLRVWWPVQACVAVLYKGEVPEWQPWILSVADLDVLFNEAQHLTETSFIRESIKRVESEVRLTYARHRSKWIRGPLRVWTAWDGGHKVTWSEICFGAKLIGICVLCRNIWAIRTRSIMTWSRNWPLPVPHILSCRICVFYQWI